MDNVRIETADKLLQDKNLQIIFGVTVMAVLGIFSITPAFPKMVVALGISPAKIGLLISVFTVPGIFLMPILGVLADLFGRKTVLVPCLVLFAVAGTLCFWARDFQSLLILRFFQGVGAAPLSSLNITLITDLFSGNERTSAMGYNQSAFSLGAAGMTALGGVLATALWSYPFLLPISALPMAYLVMFILNSPNKKGGNTFKRYAADVFIMLRKRELMGIYVATIVTFVLVSGAYLTFFPLLMGIRQDTPPLIIGLIMSGMTIASALSSVCIGKIARIISEPRLIVLAFILYALALGIVPFINKVWLLLFPAAVFGVAQGLNLPSIQAHLGGLSKVENRAILISFYGTALRLGQTAGPIIAGTFFTFYGINGVFLTSACLAVVTSGLIMYLIR